MSFSFAPARPRRRPSLTPMIDVVFLLLVFFMLAARFGQEGALELQITGAGGAAWEGPPRLVQVEPESVLLNGQIQESEVLVQALSRLTESPSDMILIRPAEAVTLQRLLDVMTLLEGAGFTSLALVNP